MTRLVEKIDRLHEHYVAAVNNALEAGDLNTAADLAEAYDQEAIQVMAEHEGRTDLLPLVRRRPADSRLHRVVAQLKSFRAA